MGLRRTRVSALLGRMEHGELMPFEEGSPKASEIDRLVDQGLVGCRHTEHDGVRGRILIGPGFTDCTTGCLMRKFSGTQPST